MTTNNPQKPAGGINQKPAGEINPQIPARGVNQPEQAMSWLQRVIERWYPSQPGWARTTVFLSYALLLALFLYGAVERTHVVQAYVMESTPAGLVPVRNKEVRLAGLVNFDVGTNNNGMAYIPVSTLSYFTLFTAGEMEVELVDVSATRMVTRMKANFNRRTSQLANFSPLKENADEDKAPVKKTSNEATPSLGSYFAITLVPSAHAKGSDPSNRLFVNWIELSKNFYDVNEGVLELAIGHTDYGLRDARTAGSAGNVPLAPGEKVLLGETHYFEIPASGNGEIVIEAARLFGFKGKQKFPVEIAKLKFGEQAILQSGEHKMAVTLMQPYDVTLFSKAGLNQNDLQEALRKKGYRSVVKPSPQGGNLETNTIFLGTKVPYTAAQVLVSELTANKIPLKAVRCGVKLSSGNQRELQVGSVVDLVNKPALPQDKLALLKTAQSADQFCGASK